MVRRPFNRRLPLASSRCLMACLAASPALARAQPPAPNPCLRLEKVRPAFEAGELERAQDLISQEHDRTLGDACRYEIDLRTFPVSVELDHEDKGQLEVTLDGGPLGTRYWSLGMHEIQIRHGSRLQPWKLRLRLERDAQTTGTKMTFFLPRFGEPPPPAGAHLAKVTVSTSAGEALVIDGVSQPTGGPAAIAEGNHRLATAGAGWAAGIEVVADSVMVKVPPRRTTELSVAETEPPRGHEATELGAKATVRIDGQASATGALTPNHEHTLDVSRPSHESWRATIAVEETADKLRLKVRSPALEPRPRWPLITAGSVAAVSLGALIWQALVASGEERDFNMACSASTTGSCDAFRGHIIDSERARGRRDVLLAATVLSTAVFGYLLAR